MNRSSRKFLVLSIAFAVLFGGFILVTLLGAVAPKVYAQQEAAAATETTVTQLPDAAISMAFLSASIVMCVSCVAAGVAVGMTGSAAIGAVAERPELLGRTILIVGLAEGIAIYGLIIAIIILQKI